VNTTSVGHGVRNATVNPYAFTKSRNCTAGSAGRLALLQLVEVFANMDDSAAVARTAVALVFANMEETSTVAANADNE